MNLRDYIKRLSDEDLERFALKVGATIGHLTNVKYGARTASAALAKQIAVTTERQVPEWELRPRDWHVIWPELIGARSAPPVPAPERAAA